MSYYLSQLEVACNRQNRACAAYRAARERNQRFINRLERWAALSFSSFVLASAVIGVISA